MANKQDKHEVTIFPLSCNPKLDKRDIAGIDVFFSCLKDAFRNPRIRNIAITGTFGVGKSSIIRSFDEQHKSPLRKRSKFLYISLGQYRHITPAAAASTTTVLNPPAASSTPGGNGTSVTVLNCPCKQSCSNNQAEGSEVSQKNAIERRLLLQIYSKFKSKNFPYSCFRQIPDAPGILQTALFVLFAMAILLLLLKAPLAQLLLEWKPQCDQIKRVIQHVLDWHEFVEASLYGIVSIGAATLFAKGFRLLIPKIKTSSFALKGTNAEWNLERDACEDYLDQYTQELVYCLKRIRKKIDNTVVFEDMDRLDEDVCVSIFTRLREINHILNTHLGHKTYVRFVFVIDDKIANRLVFDKFFDYILPIIPKLNQKSAEVILRKNLQKINAGLAADFHKQWRTRTVGRFGCKIIELLDRHPKLRQLLCRLRKWLSQYTKTTFSAKRNYWERLLSYRESEYPSIKCFDAAEGNGGYGIVHMAASSLTEYRKQFAILNEYALMVRLYHENNPDKLTGDVTEGILAFLIYKHLWPEDYHRCINCQQNVLSGRSIDEAAGGVHKPLLDYLVTQRILNIRCLHYTGFSEDTVKEFWRNTLYSGTLESQCKQIQEIQPDEPDYIEILKEFCRVDPTKPDCVSVEILSEAVKCLCRTQATQAQSGNDWFFKDRDISACLHILAKLDLQTGLDFIAWCRGMGTDYDIFSKCAGRNIVHTFNGKWTLGMAKIFVTGVCRNKIDTDFLYLTDNSPVNLKTLQGYF